MKTVLATILTFSALLWFILINSEKKIKTSYDDGYAKAVSDYDKQLIAHEKHTININNFQKKLVNKTSNSTDINKRSEWMRNIKERKATNSGNRF